MCSLTVSQAALGVCLASGRVVDGNALRRSCRATRVSARASAAIEVSLRRPEKPPKPSVDVTDGSTPATSRPAPREGGHAGRASGGRALTLSSRADDVAAPPDLDERKTKYSDRLEEALRLSKLPTALGAYERLQGLGCFPSDAACEKLVKGGLPPRPCYIARRALLLKAA